MFLKNARHILRHYASVKRSSAVVLQNSQLGIVVDRNGLGSKVPLDVAEPFTEANTTDVATVAASHAGVER
jgi:hypothetical protein